ncbi:MAG: DUF4136 domain-containing protein [Acidobacteriota bacterium]|nr:DUF4136 domain-containing protein [Acidobacteriota bacterium]
MRKTLLFCLIGFVFVAAGPAAGQKIHIDYDNATAFSEYKTFQFRETMQDLRRVSSSLHHRTVEQITDYAVEGGLAQADSEPDVYLAYYAATDRDLELTLRDLDYAYGPGFSLGSYWKGGVGTRDTKDRPFVFKEGTVVVDVWDRERKVLVWRGMATAVLKKDSSKNEKKLEKALERLMKRWEEMYGTRARAVRKLKAKKDQ